ncbi:hypothetical protein VRRI112168_02250 [Vreelandella rituensis]
MHSAVSRAFSSAGTCQYHLYFMSTPGCHVFHFSFHGLAGIIIAMYQPHLFRPLAHSLDEIKQITLIGMGGLTSSPTFSASAIVEGDSQVVTFLVPASLSVASIPWYYRSYTNSTGVTSRVPLGIASTLSTD